MKGLFFERYRDMGCKVQGYGEEGYRDMGRKVQGYGESFRQTKQRYRDMGKSFS